MEGQLEETFSDYEVFINHRGPDTKNTIASLLYERLQSLGLHVFLDREELNTGDCVSPAIMAAIDASSVHIAIFSPAYAESRWCLEELCQMLQQPFNTSTLIPIFWDVEPSHLRRVDSGLYAAAFDKHKHRGEALREVERREEALRVVEGWKKALVEAAKVKGHPFDSNKGDWGKLVSEIVDIVQKKVRRERLVVAEYPVGLDKAAKKLEKKILKLMVPSAGTTIVGIAGLGGSGKTTLATHLYNMKHSLFTRSSFLYKVSGSKLTSLQKKLLHDLGCAQFHIGNKKEGESLLRQRLRGLPPVLIVVDDIDCEEHRDSLLVGVKEMLRDGSLIVLTSRDKHLLARCGASLLFDMELLDEKDAQELFCQHAFKSSRAPTGYGHLVREMVKMCGGHPFALQVLGAELSVKQKWEWKSQLKNLLENRFPNKIVETIVKASYNSLEWKTKEAFLDVASFFEGLDTHLVVRVYGEVECPLLDCIETLGKKCLVQFHCVEVDVHDGEHEDYMSPYRDYKIGMHRIVKDLAKQIAIEECSLVSCSENQMICPDYEISDWLQQLPKGNTPHLVIVDNGIQKFQQLNYHLCHSPETMFRMFIQANYFLGGAC